MNLEDYIYMRGCKRAVALSKGEVKALGLPDYGKGWFKRYKGMMFDNQTILNALVAGSNSRSLHRKRLIKVAESFALEHGLPLDFSHKIVQSRLTLRALCNVGTTFSDRELILMGAKKLDMDIDILKHTDHLMVELADKAGEIVHAPKMSTNLDSKKFYKSKAWRIVRYNVLETKGNSCMCCGAKPSSGAVLHVDHIKPRSTHPELELDINNLQILCEDCNLGKGNQSTKEW